mgnify:CR=1 FL=1
MSDETDVSHACEFGVFLNYSPIKVEWVRQEPWLTWWPGSLWKVDIWEYTAHRKRPMEYVLPHEFILENGTRLPAGTHIQPDRHFLTDFGTVPPFFNGFPSLTRTRFLGPFIIHDSVCRYGGLWIILPTEDVAHFVVFSRLNGDDLLRLMVGSVPWNGNLAQRTMIYSGVRIGAKFKSRTDSKPGFPPPPIPAKTVVEAKKWQRFIRTRKRRPD